MPNIVKAWAVTHYSPMQLSNALRFLSVSHSIVGQAEDKRMNVLRVDGLAPEQPAWPIIYHSVSDCRRLMLPDSPQIHLVCDSIAALSHTNLSGWDWTGSPERDLQKILRKADPEPFVLKIDAPTYMDFVNVASKPSFLRLLQTAYYKITPYADQKAIKSASLAYLAGLISQRALNHALSTTLKSERVRELLQSEQAKRLMQAVERAHSDGDIEAAAEAFDMDAFEVRYIMSNRA